MRTLLALGVLALTTAAGSVRSTDVFDDAERGLRITVAEGWTCREGDGPNGKEIQLRPVEGGVVQASIRTLPASAIGTAESGRAAVVSEIRAAGERFANLEEITETFLGRELPALEVDVLQPQQLKLRQVFLVENGLFYIFQSVCGADVVDTWWAEVCGVLGGVEIVEVVVPDAELKALAARCGSEIDWAASWDEAAERARETGRPVLVHAFVYRGFDLADETLVGPFMRTDLIELVNARFVPYVLPAGELDVPFADPALYGLSPTTFGSSLLVTTPEGEVLGETVGPAYPFLIDLIARLELPVEPAPPHGDDPLLAAEHALRRGELELARELLRAPGTARGYRMRADLCRRVLDGEGALADLARAAAAPGGEELADDLALDRAWIQVRMGNHAEARAVYEAFVNERPDHPRIGEATYRLGALQHVLGAKEEAEATWRALTVARPDDRWSWKAAGMLTSTSFAIGHAERLDWPTERELEATAVRDYAPASGTDADALAAAKAQALAFLAASQNDDGSWYHTSEYANYDPAWPDDIKIAITAIAGRALLAHADDARLRARVEAALAFVRRASEHALDFGEYAFFMDHTVWSWPYALSLFAACVREGVVELDALAPLAARLLASLAESQRSNGGWSYYLTADLDGAAAPENSISFTTAAVVHGLLDAREAGFEVDDELLDAALACLEAMRNDNGSFEYFLWHGANPPRSSMNLAGSAGRGPACELALFRGGRATEADLERAVRLFSEHHTGFAAEQGKALMHSGAAGQGCHYLMFDYAMTADVLEVLGGDARAKYREFVLEDLMAARYEGGAFQDTPLLGWAMGTGFALEVLHALD